MSILVDTSVLIDVLRVEPEAIAYFQSLPAAPVCSEVTRVEILRGMRSDERRTTTRLLESFDWVPVDRSVSERAGALGRRFRASHGVIGLGDLLIAATAEIHDLPLATRNVKHFPMFPDLRPPYGEPLG